MAPVSSAKERALLGVIVACLMYKKKHKRKKRIWCKEWRWNLQSKRSLQHIPLSDNAALGKKLDFENFIQMPAAAFSYLLSKVKPLIEKQDTLLRKSISAEERLHGTLCFLTTGYSYSDLQFSTGISKQSLSSVIPETCQAIYDVLKADYMNMPQTSEGWTRVAEDFERRWDFPNCLGAVEGKHIIIKPPSNDNSSQYSNYKGGHSIILLTAVNANYEFLHAEIITGSKLSGTDAFDSSILKIILESKAAGLPSDRELPGSSRKLPYVFVGDHAFPLNHYLLKPFSGNEQLEETRIYNYRLSRVHGVADNAFGVLADKFKVLKSPIKLDPQKVEKIVLACAVLHNFLRNKYTSEYNPRGSLDEENLTDGTISQGYWRQEDSLLRLKRDVSWCSDQAEVVRHQYKEYFNQEGAVSWQRHAIDNVYPNDYLHSE